MLTPEQLRDNHDHNLICLNNISPNVTRVKVIDETGAELWKPPNEVWDSDRIQLTTEGRPVTSMKSWGRPSNDSKILHSDAIPRDKRELLMSSDLYKTIRSNPESIEVLNHALAEMVAETVYLDEERLRKESQNISTESLSRMKIRALQAISGVWLDRKKQSSITDIDLNSRPFQVLIGHIIDTFVESMQECDYSPANIENILTKLAKKMDDEWEGALKRKIFKDS